MSALRKTLSVKVQLLNAFDITYDSYQLSFQFSLQLIALWTYPLENFVLLLLILQVYFKFWMAFAIFNLLQEKRIKSRLIFYSKPALENGISLVLYVVYEFWSSFNFSWFYLQTAVLMVHTVRVYSLNIKIIKTKLQSICYFSTWNVMVESISSNSAPYVHVEHVIRCFVWTWLKVKLLEKLVNFSIQRLKFEHLDFLYF